MSETNGDTELAEGFEYVTIMGDTKVMPAITEESEAEAKEAEDMYRAELEMLQERSERNRERAQHTRQEQRQQTRQAAPQPMTRQNPPPPPPPQTKAS